MTLLGCGARKWSSKRSLQSNFRYANCQKSDPEQSYDNTAVILTPEKYFFSPYLTVHFPHPSWFFSTWKALGSCASGIAGLKKGKGKARTVTSRKKITWCFTQSPLLFNHFPPCEFLQHRVHISLLIFLFLNECCVTLFFYSLHMLYYSQKQKLQYKLLKTIQ